MRAIYEKELALRRGDAAKRHSLELAAELVKAGVVPPLTVADLLVRHPAELDKSSESKLAATEDNRSGNASSALREYMRERKIEVPEGK